MLLPLAAPAPSTAPSAYLSFKTRADTSTKTSFAYDVVVYGSTMAALAAAIQMARMNRTIAVVSPESHLGGMTTSGLGWTDSKRGSAIGGIAREFYSCIYQYYLSDSAWTAETRQGYINRKISAQPGPAIDATNEVQWTFEPGVAEQVVEDWMVEYDIDIYRNELISRTSDGVDMSGTTIKSFTTLSGKTFNGKMFIDGGYEGDLMATAGVPYSVGRESEEDFDESLAGMVLSNPYTDVDPYIEKGNTGSGLLTGIEQTLYSPLSSSFNGSADAFRVQSFNFRLTLTHNAGETVAWSKPDGYNESDYELLLRYYEAGLTTGTFTDQLMPNNKTDSNSNSQVSFDFVGGSYDSKTATSYSEMDYDDRGMAVANHIKYQQGLLWTLSSNTRIPSSVRSYVNNWGLSKDEYASNNHWPYQMYIRESRRMKGPYTMTQQNVQSPSSFTYDAVVGLGSYSLDSHTVRRVVLDGTLYDEGYFYEYESTPYPIPYEVMTPEASDATNLLCPVTFSATHAATGSLRMEPTYMILGQSAGTAAVLALEDGVSVQDVDKSALTARLKADRQVLSA